MDADRGPRSGEGVEEDGHLVGAGAARRAGRGARVAELPSLDLIEVVAGAAEQVVGYGGQVGVLTVDERTVVHEVGEFPVAQELALAVGAAGVEVVERV